MRRSDSHMQTAPVPARVDGSETRQSGQQNCSRQRAQEEDQHKEHSWCSPCQNSEKEGRRGFHRDRSGRHTRSGGKEGYTLGLHQDYRCFSQEDSCQRRPGGTKADRDGHHANAQGCDVNGIIKVGTYCCCLGIPLQVRNGGQNRSTTDK